MRVLGVLFALAVWSPSAAWANVPMYGCNYTVSIANRLVTRETRTSFEIAENETARAGRLSETLFSGSGIRLKASNWNYPSKQRFGVHLMLLDETSVLMHLNPNLEPRVIDTAQAFRSDAMPDYFRRTLSGETGRGVAIEVEIRCQIQ